MDHIERRILNLIKYRKVQQLDLLHLLHCRNI
jgi:hypothetical protein